MVFSWVILTYLFSFKNITCLNHKNTRFISAITDLTLRATKGLNKRSEDPEERGRSGEQTGENEGSVIPSFCVCVCVRWIVL